MNDKFSYGIYSIKSDIKGEDREIENIGSTGLDLAGRLHEKYPSNNVFPPEVNYFFKIIWNPFASLVYLEKQKIHKHIENRDITKDFKYQEIAKKELFFRYGKNNEYTKPLIEVIKDFLILNNVKFELILNPKIKPKRRQKKPKNEEHVENDTTKLIFLREDQEKALDFMDSRDKGTIIFPAGCGKTIIYITYIKNYNSGLWLILVPTCELVSQVHTELKNFRIPCVEYKTRLSNPIPNFFVIVSTYNSSEDYKDYNFDGIIVDECHRVVLTRQNPFSKFQAHMKTFECKKRFYFSATPKIIVNNNSTISMDKHEFFGDNYRCSIERAIQKGYIVDYRVKLIAYSEDNRPEKILDILVSFEPVKAIIFCNTTKEVDDLTIKLENKTKYNIYKIHSKLSEKENNRTFKNFANKPTSILISCDMVSAGYDRPEVDYIIHYSGVPESHIKNTQRNGRGQRVYPEKLFYRVFYLINKLEDCKKVIRLLSKYDPRYRNIIPEVSLNINEESFITYLPDINNFKQLDKSPTIEITRELVKIFSNSTLHPQERLKKILHSENKYYPKIKYRNEAINLCTGIIEDVEMLCCKIPNFLEFSLPKKIYENYILGKEIKIENIKAICKANLIKDDKQYKSQYKKYNLPSYEDIMNGIVPAFKNLRQILSEDEEEYD